MGLECGEKGGLRCSEEVKERESFPKILDMFSLFLFLFFF